MARRTTSRPPSWRPRSPSSSAEVSLRLLASLASGPRGGAFLQDPAVAVGVVEEDERVPRPALAVDEAALLEMLHRAHLDATGGQLLACGVDVVDDELRPLQRAGLGSGDARADH